MKRKIVTLCMAICMIAGAVAFATPAISATQGDVALRLASYLDLDTSSVENAIAALADAGIVPGDKWDAGATVDAAFAGNLLTTVNAVAESGAITAPPNLSTASALTAAVLTCAGVDAATAVTGIVAAGGNQDNAKSGAAIGKKCAKIVPGVPSGTTITTDIVSPDATPPAGIGGGGSGTQSS